MRSLAILLLLAAPAVAQPAPLTLPSRDVSVVYRVEGAARDAVPGGIPGNLRLAWNADRHLLRVEPEGRTQSLLVDFADPRVQLLDSGLHTAMAFPLRAKDLDPLKLQGAHLTASGHATVNGHGCTEYAVEARGGHGTLCLTADGVALRGSGTVNGRDGSFTAVSVSYAPLPPALFEVPASYSHFALPAGLGRLQ